MGADWLNPLEGVGGRLVSAARVFVHSEGPSPPGNGVEGIRWLAQQLDRFVDRESTDAQDDRFVEGAGALLGLLLIDHMGGCVRERDGCHRVQLGRFGWFDPFVAVQDALDAEDPRACLASYLSLAEREAAQEGPISRIVRAFAEALRRERPDLDIESQFELTVDLNNGARVDLSRLERVGEDQDDDTTMEAARRIISMLPGADTQIATPWSEAASRLFPRLLSSEFLASLPSEQNLHTEAVGLDVHVGLQLRYGSRARYVRRVEVEAWAEVGAVARDQAVANLVSSSQTLRLEPVGDHVVRVRQGDGLDGARILLPDLPARLLNLSGDPWVAASPHRDVLLLAYGGGIDELARLARDAVRRAPHPVSASLFAITPDGPRPLPR